VRVSTDAPSMIQPTAVQMKMAMIAATFRPMRPSLSALTLGVVRGGQASEMRQIRGFNVAIEWSAGAGAGANPPRKRRNRLVRLPDMRPTLLAAALVAASFSLQAAPLTEDGRNSGNRFTITKLPRLPSQVRGVRMTSNGSEFLIAAATPPELRVMTVDRDGNVQKQFIAGTTSYWSLAAASDGRDFLIAWTDNDGTFTRVVTAEVTMVSPPRRHASH